MTYKYKLYMIRLRQVIRKVQKYNRKSIS